ncbi:MAG: radical SAM family heme chaperone HemW [Bacteroidia bacterium]
MFKFTQLMSGIYIHIPYCKKACSYCDFHFSTNLNNKPELVKSLLQEIDLRHNYLNNNTLQSVYFGGGTPSLLSFDELFQILNKIKQYFKFDNAIEITLECNPDDITEESLNNWLKLGINRLSVGLQSFNNDELLWMNRAHNAEQSLNCIEFAKKAGFKNISIDLIYGSKFQTENTWLSTIDTLLKLNIQHVSAYNLTIENGTLLGNALKKGKEPPINDDFCAWQFEKLSDKLTNDGFVHYEISNFGLPNFIAVHNSNYWKQKPYLGIGPSAHSYNLDSRQWNVKSNANYIQSLKNKKPFFEIETLSIENKFNEYIFTGLRTIWGCNLNDINSQFGEKYLDYCKSVLTKHKESFIQKENNFSLTTSGRLIADKLASEFFYLIKN